MNKGNIKDFTNLLHIVILSNLERTNTELIDAGAQQRGRLINLNKLARSHLDNSKEILTDRKLNDQEKNIKINVK